MSVKKMVVSAALPFLVEWKVSADGLRYTFKLRAGVKWSDGEPLTSADMRFSVMTQKALGPRGRITLASVDRVDTPDPLTAVIVLAKPANHAPPVAAV